MGHLSKGPVTQDGVVVAAGRVRGTQSFVHTLSECWRRPSLTALEVLWRWAYGIPALLVLWHVGLRILRETPVDFAALQSMSVSDPMGAATTLAKALDVLLPPVLKVAMWLAPLLVVGWVVVSSVGRTVVLRRADGRLHQQGGDADRAAVVACGGAAGEFCGVVLVHGAGGEWTVTGSVGGGR